MVGLLGDDAGFATPMPLEFGTNTAGLAGYVHTKHFIGRPQSIKTGVVGRGVDDVVEEGPLSREERHPPIVIKLSLNDTRAAGPAMAYRPHTHRLRIVGRGGEI